MKKILFIDDNTSLLEEITEALNFEGYDAYGADNGFKGIEMAKDKKPDLILCDILMPEIDGFEVYSQLKDDASTSLIPFIFLTALAEQKEIRRGMELGADDYILKPILLENLLNVICTRLQKSAEINNQMQTQLNELRDRVLHILPHELLTPLNGIIGFAGIIKDDSESIRRSKIKEMASHIEVCGNNLFKVINNYLNYVFVTTRNGFDIKEKSVNAHEIIKEISLQVAEEYDRVDDLILELENAELMIEYDDLVFVIRELVDNAFKFSKPKSNVVVMNICNNEQMEIQIEDHGIGFPIDKMSDIGAFNQFNKEKLAQRGSGLGLITSMLIAQRHKGSLQINGATIGTTVKVIFPLSTQIIS